MGTYMNEIPNAASDDPVQHECVPCIGNCMPGFYLEGACPAVRNTTEKQRRTRTRGSENFPLFPGSLRYVIHARHVSS